MSWLKNSISKRQLHFDAHCNTIYNSQYLETTQVSKNRVLNEKPKVHILKGILLGNKKRWKHAVCYYVDESGKFCAEGSKSEEMDKHWSLISVREWKKQSRGIRNTGTMMKESKLSGGELYGGIFYVIPLTVL